MSLNGINKLIKSTICLSTIVSLASWADVESYQRSCMQSYSEFPQIVSCLKQALINDPSYNQPGSDADLVKLYLEYADRLVEQVNNGVITISEAKALMDQMYIKLKTQSTSRRSITSSSTTPTGTITSYIDGEFKGWEGDTIFKLDNGQIWQQDSYSYHYHYAYHPKVIIFMDNGRYKMHVDGLGETVYVRQLR